MKILIVNSWYYPNSNGGAEVICRKLAEKLAARGHSVDVLTVGEQFQQCSVNHVNVTYLDTFIGKYTRTNKPNPLLNLTARLMKLYAFADYGKIKRQMKKGYDVVHTHTIEDISPVVWSAAKSCGIPVVHTMHDKYLLCPRLFMINGKQQECHTPRLVCVLRQKIYRRFSKNVAVFVSPSHALAECMPVKCTVVNNGVELRTRSHAKRADNQRPFRYLYVGNLEPHKGLNYLLNAFEMIEGEAELHIVGDGYFREKVEQLMKQDPRIHFYGWVSNDRVKEIMCECDCLVHPTVWKETSSMIIMEAFSCGIPVVASRIGAIPEIVDDEKTGFFFEPADVDDLYHKMLTIAKESVWDRLTENIHQELERFDIDRMVSQYEAIYMSLTSVPKGEA